MKLMDVAFGWEQASLFLRLQRTKIGSGAVIPRYPIHIDTSAFTIKTVDHIRELEMAFRLRYDVFHREMLSKKIKWGWDLDRFDFQCDHLIIVEKKTGNVIGTYRMMNPQRPEEFYTATEFTLGTLPHLPGKKVELGRACIHPDHRTGAVIATLWRGIAEYVRASGTRYLLGCSSIKTQDPAMIEAICQKFKTEGAVSAEFGVVPLPAFSREGLAQELGQDSASVAANAPSEAQIEEMIPALIKSYIKAGAKVCPEPAVDRDFQCVDFVTVLDLENLTEAYRRRFLPPT